MALGVVFPQIYFHGGSVDERILCTVFLIACTRLSSCLLSTCLPAGPPIYRTACLPAYLLAGLHRGL